MSEKIYLYPKTSCPCADCGTKYPVETGLETNLSIAGGTLSPYYDCYYAAEISSSVQPKTYPYEKRMTELNPQCYTDKIAEGFGKVKCEPSNSSFKNKARASNTSNNCADGCNDPTYISLDPRLYSSTRADYLPLDRPPIDGNVRLKNVYDKKYDNYGAGFTPYKDIKDGQIVYYIDRDVQDAFISPVFAQEATEKLEIYQDPMGAIKPQATRFPIHNTENPTTVSRPSYDYGLSFLQDTNGQREDIISYQQRKHNQQKWTVRWPAQ